MAMLQSDFIELITGYNPIKERQKIIDIVLTDKCVLCGKQPPCEHKKGKVT